MSLPLGVVGVGSVGSSLLPAIAESPAVGQDVQGFEVHVDLLDSALVATVDLPLQVLKLFDRLNWGCSAAERH
eukprot:jgi/Phyca11/509881/fgenesh2_kg.PHYCAscaffold_51_\